MLIIPAIDLQNGRCVRLKQGKFDQITAVDEDPIQRAAYFSKLNATRMHLVDLDGARTGQMQQFQLIKAMQQTNMPMQAGGGIRNLETARKCLAAGISYLVIGSLAISEPETTQQIINEISPSRIILALDVQIEDGIPLVATNGWQTRSTQSLWKVVEQYQGHGITEVLCTDIACDGMMSGPNFNLYQQAIDRFPNVFWQASGGIRSKQDLQQLESIGVSAAILGLILYQEVNFLEELLLC